MCLTPGCEPHRSAVSSPSKAATPAVVGSALHINLQPAFPSLEAAASRLTPASALTPASGLTLASPLPPPLLMLVVPIQAAANSAAAYAGERIMPALLALEMPAAGATFQPLGAADRN